MKLLGMGGGMDFSESGTRDVFFQGKCDDGCLQLARHLGWEVSQWAGTVDGARLSTMVMQGQALRAVQDNYLAIPPTGTIKMTKP